MTPITVPQGVGGVQSAGVGGRMPVGWNRVRIEVADDSEKSKNGHDQIAFEFSNQHGSVRHWLVITENPKSWPFIKRDLEACGVDFANTNGVINAKAFEGKTIDVLIAHEPGTTKDNQPTMYARVKAMRKAEGEDPTPASAPPVDQPIPAGAAAPGSAYMSEDDIPF